MMDTVQYSKDEKKARIAAFIFAIILLFLVLFPFWSYTFPPPEQEGILVSFGQYEVMGGDQIAESQKEAVEKPNDGEKKEVKSEVSEKVEPSKSKPKPQVEAVKAKAITEKESPVAVQEKKSSSEKSVEQKKADEAAAKAAAEAKKQAEFEKTKKQFGDLIGKGTATGENRGNAGDPKGDPNANVLTGISKGKGKIQGGLSDRGLMYEPEIDENSQKSGKVVVKVCVDNQGKVIEASYTQRGSTTTDTGLVEAAIDGAKKYRFSKSPIDKQCGTITIEFKLK